MEKKHSGSGSATELGLSEKSSFHGEKVIQDPSHKGCQKPQSAPTQSAPRGHTIK